jgi:acetyltransferase
MVVSDSLQGKGLGTEFLTLLIQIARDEKVSRLHADILSDNVAMQKVCQKLGFQLTRSLTEPTVEAELALA